MKVITIFFLAVIPFLAHAEHSLTVGLWTEHYSHDRPGYNENNKLASYTYKSGETVYSVASFKNSHFDQSYMVGVGEEWRLHKYLSLSASLGVIHGYYGHIPQTTGHILISPIFSAKIGYLRGTILGNAVNVGVVYGF